MPFHFEITPFTFSSVLNGYLPEPQSSLLNGILFGLPLKKSLTLYADLKTVGLIHLVVLSGMNITLLSAILGRLTIQFGRYMSLVINILVIILFILFVSPQAPIIRAGIMSILTSVALIYGRKAYPLWALFLAGFVTFLIWPKWVFSLSFQLSYLSTLGLIIFAKKAPVQIKKNLREKVITYAKDEFRTSISAQIFTVPIIFFYFRQISFISPVSNILVSFLIAPLMILGFMAAILGKVHFILGIIPATIAYGLLTYMMWVIELLSHIPYASIKF